MFLSIVANTYLKQTTAQSNPKDTANFVFVREGDSFPLTSFEWEPKTNHYKVTLKNKINNTLTWYVFCPHVSLLDENGKAVVLFNRPSDTGPNVDREELDDIPAEKPKQGAFIEVGSVKYYLKDPIIPGGSFTWEEGITYDIRRKPNRQQADAIIAVAKRLQPYRDRAGVPFEITSWFRPEPFNRQAGGASRSQHLTGSAVDLKIKVNGKQLTGRQMYSDYFKDWKGGVGIYPKLPYIIHLDVGPARKWGF